MDDVAMTLLQDNPELLYEKYSNVISVEEIPLEGSVLEDCARAYEYNSNGSVDALECELTLSKITCMDESVDYRTANTEESTYYVLMAVTSTKTSEDSTTQNGVTLKGCIGWEDWLGPVNKFSYASGSRSGSYNASEQAYYLATRGTTNLCSGYFDTSFYSTSNLSDTTGSQFRLMITTKDSSGNKVELNFFTSIFD